MGRDKTHVKGPDPNACRMSSALLCGQDNLDSQGQIQNQFKCIERLLQTFTGL